MTTNSATRDRRQLYLSVTVLTLLACAVYFLVIPLNQASAGKKSRSRLMFATTVFPTSAALPAPVPDNVPAGISLDIPVAGLTDQVRGVALNITMDQPAGAGGHTWVGDLNMTLNSPDMNSHLIMQRTGSTTGTGNGDSSDVQGPYTFGDGTVNNWWAAAASGPSAFIIPPGTYRTSACCTGANTEMNPVFMGPALADGTFDYKDSSKRSMNDLPVDNIGNGTWTFDISDNAGGDTGRVAELSLIITTLAPTAALAAIRGTVSANGRGVPYTKVTLVNTNTGEALTVMTNNLGYYRFEDLTVGDFYTLDVIHKRYQFEQRSFTLDDDIEQDFDISN